MYSDEQGIEVAAQQITLELDNLVQADFDLGDADPIVIREDDIIFKWPTYETIYVPYNKEFGIPPEYQIGVDAGYFY